MTDEKIINLRRIQEIIEEKYDTLYFRIKRHIIKAYEEEENIKVVDSAYPIDWGDAVRKEFNIRDIGDWCWGYGEGMTFGFPLPCNPRSLVLFEIMISNDHTHVHPPLYVTQDELKTFKP